MKASVRTSQCSLRLLGKEFDAKAALLVFENLSGKMRYNVAGHRKGGRQEEAQAKIFRRL